ncbi:MAG: ATPase involved in chromosome partitioning-like protein [Actinomycetia bacterium]|nr:ATPase involved in chromosome partitioning-like protein [Actinomycetes bacterium]
MDLPTYTNIWRIEKRLYKLYDFRLPAPLPINWIAVFAGITVPYILLLVAIGLPFNHTLVWLYVLPPGVLTWLTTRPVIESKRLHELLESQIRYLAEPRVWCRMAPLEEKDQVAVTARVWHSNRLPRERAASMAALLERGSLARRKPGVPLRPPRVPVPAASAAGSGLAALAGGAVAGSTVAGGTAASGGAARGVARDSAGTAPRRGGAAKDAVASNRAVGRGIVKRRAAEGTAAASFAARDTADGRRAAAALAAGPVAPAPPLPAYGATRHPAVLGGTLARPAAAPVLSAGQPHATPAVWPAAAAPSGAVAGSGTTAPAVAPPATFPGTVLVGTVLPRTVAPGTVVPGTASPAPAPAPAPSPASTAAATAATAASGAAIPATSTQPTGAQPTGTSADAATAPSAVQVRARGTGPGGARVEVAHGGPAQRKVPPATPANSAHAWPSVGMSMPVHPGPVPPASMSPASTSASTVLPQAPQEPDAQPASGQPALGEAIAPAAAAESSSAAPAAGRVARRKELFSLLTGRSTASAQQPAAAAAPPAAAAPAAPAAPVVPPAPAAAAADRPSVAVQAVEPQLIAPPVPGTDAPPVPGEPPQPAQRSAQAQAPRAPERGRPVPSIERALSGPSRDRNLSWHTRVRFVAGATQGPGARDQEALDRARARLPLKGSKRVLILGCTSGAGQTVTALMTGHILASLREEPVAAVDLHDGTLGKYTAPAAILREVLDGAQPQGQPAAHPDGLHPKARSERQRTMEQARLDVISSDDPLRDGDERRLAEHLGRHYPLTVLDPGATGLTRLLRITDQLVIVAPASVEAASALADTRDWLDAHGFAELATHSVTLVNGVSRRSLADVEAAEAVARGRCRAIVRVPWDDMLPMGNAGPSSLHPQTRVAYTALAGVLVAGMAAAPVRRPQ